MKIIIKVLIVFNLFTSLFAQKEEGEISILSEKVGKLIDLEERNKFKLFPAEGFQSAVLYKLPDGKYYFKITRIDGSTGDEIQYRIEQSESEIGKIRKYLENFSDYTGLSDEQSEIRRNQIEWGQNDTTFIQTRHPGLITTVKGQLIPFARVDVNQGILSYLPAGSKKIKSIDLTTVNKIEIETGSYASEAGMGMAFIGFGIGLLTARKESKIDFPRNNLLSYNTTPIILFSYTAGFTFVGAMVGNAFKKYKTVYDKSNLTAEKTLIPVNLMIDKNTIVINLNYQL